MSFNFDYKTKSPWEFIVFILIFLIWCYFSGTSDHETTTADIVREATEEMQALNQLRDAAGWMESSAQGDTALDLHLPLNKVRLREEDASLGNPYIQAALEIKKRYSEKLWHIEGINRVAITLTKHGNIAFLVGTDSPMNPTTNPELPGYIEGIPIIYKVMPLVILSP